MVEEKISEQEDIIRLSMERQNMENIKVRIRNIKGYSEKVGINFTEV